jgi:hypothetical protein
MKKNILTTGLKTVILTTILASSPMLYTAAHAADAPAAAAAEKEAPMAIPDTAAGIWEVVDKETEEMSKLIQAGTLKDLHHHAFAVRDLVAALPAKSASLPADKMAKLKTDSKSVATLADRLDAAGDSNNKTAAESNFGKLKGVLTSIRANYADAK